MSMNGQPLQFPSAPHLEPPPKEGVLQLLKQRQTPEGILVDWMIVAPGRTFSACIDPDDAEKFAATLAHYAQMSKAGLIVST